MFLPANVLTGALPACLDRVSKTWGYDGSLRMLTGSMHRLLGMCAVSACDSRRFAHPGCYSPRLQTFELRVVSLVWKKPNQSTNYMMIL